MKVMDRESFLISRGDSDTLSTMLCVRFIPLALLAEEAPESEIEKIKEEIEYRGGLCFPDCIACWSGHTLFIWCPCGPQNQERITEECHSYADLIQERYTLITAGDTDQLNGAPSVRRHHHLRAVIGAALCEADQPTKGLRDSEKAAMKATKDTGHCVVWYQAEVEPVVGNLAITRGVVEMLNYGSFRLVYQPQIDLGTGQIHGVEVLIRAPDDPGHPLYGMAPPALIQAASNLNLLTDLTIQIIHRATRAYYGWQTLCGGIPLKISINITPDTLLNGHQAILDSLPPGMKLDWLVFEITENQDFLADSSSTLAEITALIRSHGIEISIDDFGKGLSNFDRLNEISCDEIKLDRSLVTRMIHQEVDQDIVQMIVAVAKEYGLRVVGEGIENAAQWTMLQSTGCHVGQGFFLSEGKSETAIANYLMRLRKLDRNWLKLKASGSHSVVW